MYEEKVKFAVIIIVMDRKIYVIVMAAGSGLRMGADKPKQFLELGGRPILQRTIERFYHTIPDARIVTVLPADSISYWREWCMDNGFHVPQILVAGGITRFHSVRNALARVPDGAIVAVHDGVRPLLSEEMILGMVDRMKSCRALIPVIPMVDTLKVLEKDAQGVLQTVDGVTVDRSQVFGAQTPQMFLSEDLKSAYELPFDTMFTDDASVAQAKKIPLSYVQGERFNIKITTRDDLVLAGAILALKGDAVSG